RRNPGPLRPSFHRRGLLPPGGHGRRSREPGVHPRMSTATSSLRRRTNRFAYAFIAPAALCFALFLAIPILYAIFVSFRHETVVGLGLGEGGRTEIWAGLSNYAAVLSDPQFMASVGRVLLYGLVLVPTMLGLALLFALLLD